MVKTQPTSSTMSSEAAGGGVDTNSTNSTSAPPNSAQTATPKDPRPSTGEGNSTALHWLADLATQKAKVEDTKGKGQENIISFTSSSCLDPNSYYSQ